MNKHVKVDSPSIQAHLSILQSIIQRMSSNSASVKAWCVSLVSAVLVVVIDKGKNNCTLIAFFPILLFFALDAYYLALEKGFRGSYDKFIKKLHKEKLVSEDLFAVSPEGNTFKLFIHSLGSFAIFPFYTTLGAMVFLTNYLVTHNA